MTLIRTGARFHDYLTIFYDSHLSVLTAFLLIPDSFYRATKATTTSTSNRQKAYAPRGIRWH